VTRTLLVLAVLLASIPALAQPAERPAPEDRDWRGWNRGKHHDGVHLRVLRSYHLPEGSTVREPIVVLGGSATIDGRAEDDVVVIGGRLRVGPTAVVLGDVVAVGGRAEIDPAARVEGRVENTSIAGPDVQFGRGWEPWRLSRGFWASAALGATLVRLGLTLLVALLAAAVFPGWLREVAARTSSVPGTVAAVGVAGELLIVPVLLMVVIALVLSIVGIPLLLDAPVCDGRCRRGLDRWSGGRRRSCGRGAPPAVRAATGASRVGRRAGLPRDLVRHAGCARDRPRPGVADAGIRGIGRHRDAHRVRGMDRRARAVLLTLWNGGPQTVPPPLASPSPVSL
jgi:hypothetical protein